MRVLYVPSWYPSDKNPFAGSFIRDLAEDLASEEIQIEVAAFHYHVRDISSKQYLRIEKEYLMEHHFHGWSMPKINAFFQSKWIVKCMRALTEVVSEKQYDFIHAHDYVALFLATELSKQWKIPLLSSLHHSDIMMDMVPSWRKQKLQEIFSLNKNIIVPSSALKNGIEQYFGKYACQIIPNYLDLNSIKIKASLNDIPKRFVSIGSLEPLKNHKEAIELFIGFDGELSIYGEGPSRKEIERFIIKHDLGNKIHLKGTLHYKKLMQEMHQYDALISTSNYETFGLGILEGIAAGMPVICKNKYGPKDFINKNNGVFMEKGFSLHDFSKDYHLYESEKIRSSISSTFDKKSVLKKYVQYYREFKREICVE